MLKYYSKDLPDQAVWINGAPFKFDFIATEDPVLIRNLDHCIAAHKGGILSITKERYDEEIKKKQSGNNYDNGSPKMRQQGLSALNRNLAAVAAADRGGVPPQLLAGPQDGGPRSAVSGRPMPDPIQVPSPGAFSGLLKRPETAKITPP